MNATVKAFFETSYLKNPLGEDLTTAGNKLKTIDVCLLVCDETAKSGTSDAQRHIDWILDFLFDNEPKLNDQVRNKELSIDFANQFCELIKELTINCQMIPSVKHSFISEIKQLEQLLEDEN